MMDDTLIAMTMIFLTGMGLFAIVSVMLHLGKRAEEREKRERT